MPDTPDIASVAALLGDPTRARMLSSLMDGRAQTATELAVEGGVTPSTASSHLARLTALGVLAVARQGRHRYFRIANPQVARVVEGLMSIAPRRRPAGAVSEARDEGLRRARVCYDHLAGELGVRLLERLREKRLVSGGDEGLTLTRAGEIWCAGVGIDLSALRASRRRLCRACLDWSERRVHLAGGLGAALLDRLLGLRCARREAGSRALTLSQRGSVFVEHLEL